MELADRTGIDLRRNSNWRMEKVRCSNCGSLFTRRFHWAQKYCSSRCVTKHNMAIHRIYVAENIEHVRKYALDWHRCVWGSSNRMIAEKAEDLAISTLLPQLGFTNLYHASKVRRFVPFDIIGTYHGDRVLVDVTTAIGKGGPMYRSEVAFARALRMKLYFLFIKPDLRHYSLKVATEGHGLHCSSKDLVAIG